MLAALARSPDNVHTIWQHVETQQLVGGQVHGTVQPVEVQ